MQKPMLWCMAAVLAATAADPAAAQTFPDHAIKLVVPVPPGGATDAVARLVGGRLQALLGQPVITENQPGAGGAIAARAVAAARPDGYTLLIGGVAILAIGPALRTAGGDPHAFAPVAVVSSETMVLVVNPAVPADTVAEFVRYAAAHPGKLNYGSAPGIAPHFISELFRLRTGTSITHIPYKGAGPVVTDLLAGHIDMAFNTKSVLLPLARQGRLRALAVTSAARWPELPDVPTLIEAGIFTAPLETWWGIAAPAGTPRPTVATLNGALNAALRSPEMRASFESLGIEPRGGTPEDFDALLAREFPRWMEIIRMTGIRME